MNELNKLVQPISRLVCAVAAFTLLTLGALDVQSDKIEKGSKLIGVSVPLVGFVVGAKGGKDANGGGQKNGN
jgi:hypothetical protein